MNLLPGSGYDQADLMVVADYARKADESNNECLSGFYRRKVADYLAQSNFKIDQVYCTCVIKAYEKGLGVGTWGQDKKLLALFYETHGLSEDYFLNELIQEINTIKPSVIIAMGEYALQVLTGRKGITNYRGSVLPPSDSLQFKLQLKAPLRIVITQHPSIEHTAEEQRFLLGMDFHKAVDLIYNPYKRIDAHEIVIVRTTNDWLQFRKNYPDNPERMVNDLETHRGFITCSGVSYDGYRAAVLPMIGSRTDPLVQAQVSKCIAADLANPLIGKGNQNINYDQRISQRFGFTVKPVVWDTMLAASLIAPEFPKRLGFLTSVYCDGAYHKDEGKEFDPSKHSYDQLYEYCGKDCIKTGQIWDKQVPELESLDALEFMRDYMMRWYHMYYDVETIGILQDSQKQRELVGKYEGLKAIKLMELEAITGIPLKNLAYKAVGDFMEQNYFPVLRHRVDSGYMLVNTDAESLKKMRSASPLEYRGCKIPYEHAIRFINLVLLIRRIDKIIEYLDVGIHPDGRIRCSVRLTATTSGRTANSKTADQAYFWEPDKKGILQITQRNLGNSLQTVTKHGFIVEGNDDEDIEEGIIGKDVREMYVPDPGWVLMEYDRSQAEARVVDLLAEDYEGLDDYARLDKHSKAAAIIFTEYTYEQIRSMYKSGNDEGAYMRQIGKKTVHATNYDMGAYRLSNLANISMKLADKALKAMHAAKPWIKGVYHENIEKEVRAKRRLDNPYGRPRMFYKKLDGHGIKVAYSWFPQSTISDGTKLAMLKTWDEIDKQRAYLVAENHDSVTALVKRGYLRQYHKIITKHLLEPIDFRRGSFYRDYQLVIPCEGSISRTNWGQMSTLRKVKL